MSTSYYEVLGLAPLADGAMVDQAYWHLAKTYRSMAEADPRARIMLDELNEAYAVLGTPRLREEYDATLRAERPGCGQPSARGATRGAKGRAGWRFKLPLPRFPSGQTAPAVADPAPLATPPTRQPQATSRLERQKTPAGKHSKANVSDLRASTAKMLERWRANAGIQAQPSHGDGSGPDMTLVDIFKTEKELESREDPLAAVMEILKAPKDKAPKDVAPILPDR